MSMEIGKPPDLVVFGFANTAIRGFLNSNVSNPKIGKFIMRNSEYAESKWGKPFFGAHELQNMGVQIFTFSDGKTVWFIDNEYGDRAVDLFS